MPIASGTDADTLHSPSAGGHEETQMGEDKEHGEGNYKASREYDEAAHAAAKDEE